MAFSNTNLGGGFVGVQSANGSTAGNPASVSLAFGSNLGSGRLLVVTCKVGNTANTATISDTGGNAWSTKLVKVGVAATGFMWYSYNSIAVASTVNIANLGAASGNVRYTIAECSGVTAVTDPGDKSATGSGTTGGNSADAMTSGNTATTTCPIELLIGFAFVENSGTVTAGTNDTAYESPAVTNIAEYRVVTSTGAYAMTAQSTLSDAWIVLAQTFKASVNMPWPIPTAGPSYAI